MSNIYVASSHRNKHQPGVVIALRDAGHSVYDFKNPHGGPPFSWSIVSPNWHLWDTNDFIRNLKTEAAQEGLQRDYKALCAADTVILVGPCGRSAHLELGYAIGNKRTAIYLPEPQEPELMYGMVDFITSSLDELVMWADTTAERAFTLAKENETLKKQNDFLIQAMEAQQAKLTALMKAETNGEAMSGLQPSQAADGVLPG